MAKRVILLKVNQGEPTDGSGRVCIHLYVQDKRGPFVEPHVLHPIPKEDWENRGRYEATPTRGRLACDRTKTVAPKKSGNKTTITHRVDDPRAVTCPKCMASAEYIEAMRIIQESADRNK